MIFPFFSFIYLLILFLKVVGTGEISVKKEEYEYEREPRKEDEGMIYTTYRPVLLYEVLEMRISEEVSRPSFLFFYAPGCQHLPHMAGFCAL